MSDKFTSLAIINPKYRIFPKYSDRQASSKQCRPRSDAAERGVWSGSTLFAIHPTISRRYTKTGICGGKVSKY